MGEGWLRLHRFDYAMSILRRRRLLVFPVVWAALAPVLLSHADVVINELHVDPAPKTSFVEFVELHNTGAAAVDLSGWHFSDGVQFTFPAGATLPAGGYGVVAGNPGAVQAAFGVSGVFGPWGDSKLANEGETVTLRNPSGAKVDEVTYKVGFPWPTVGDEPSYSMELLNPAFDNDLGGNWRSSSGANANPATLLAAGASGWKYVKGTAEPAGGWRAPGFDASAWLSATLPAGYGESGLATTLSDMQNNYTTVYFRRTFEVVDAGQIAQLQAQIRYDDGFNLWINGVHVLSNNVSGAELPYTATANLNREDNTTVTFPLPDPSGYLQTGTNTIAVQLLNQRLSSGDCYLNLELLTTEGAGAGPTPGAVNSVFTTQAPTALRQVQHTPQQPAAGEVVTVTAKATDPDGIAAMALEYQVVEPGSYIRLTDAAYTAGANWTAVAMVDDGTNGDATAGDALYTARIPAAVQTHRRLVRYRIRATDSGGRVTPAPCADDPVPNFAYFVYNGVPDWQGALQPGATPVLAFPAATLTNIPVYHLIANNSDVINCQYNSAYNDDVYRWYGTLVYNGKVYDHIGYRIRGSASTYNTGKNKWKFRFRTGHDFEALDEDGNPYPYKWENLTLSALMCPWWANDASTGGTILNETAGMTLYRLAGVPAIRSHFFHYRIVDDAVEASAASQYEGDFWGLYIAIEETEADYIKSNGLPDGNIYNCNGSVGASVKRNQGPTAVQDSSDFSAEMSYTTGHHKPSPYQPYRYWEQNIALDNYYRFNAINHLVNNTDMYLGGSSIERNLVYYLNPETSRWYTLPWDLDLTFESAPHLGYPDTGWEHFWYVTTYSEANIAYQNVVREVSDLLVRNGDAVKVIEAAAARLCPFAGGVPVSANGWPQANQAMWDYHPRATKKGIFYKNMYGATDFTGYFNYLKNYVTTSGYGGAAVEAKLTLAGVPATPAVTYAGSAGYPADDLRFQVGAFSDTDGGTFAALQWRIAEITPTTAPGYPAVAGGIRYEINAAWTNESAAYAADVRIPAAAVQAGRVYRVRARMKDNSGKWSRWSAPVEFIAAAPNGAGDLIANLVVSEFNYNPSNPTAAEIAAAGAGIDNNSFEFIELHNISTSQTLDLSGLAFTTGITYSFAGAAITTLGPGEYVLVVADPVAFAARYGSGLPVAGTYSGKLDGAGERIALALAGTTIRDFTYDDAPPWPTTPDGSGPTLVLADPASNPDHNLAASWRASYAAGGTPGAGEAPILGWRLANFGTTEDAGDAADAADPDQDGIANLAEYALGLDPNTAGTLAANVEVDTAGGYLRLSVTRNPDATDVALAVEVSADLVNWADVEDVDIDTEADAATLLVVGDRTAIEDAPRRFVRCRVTYTGP